MNIISTTMAHQSSILSLLIVFPITQCCIDAKGIRHFKMSMNKVKFVLTILLFFILFSGITCI